jgi:signal transduction histidine kinase/HAMP domain-containing protein
LALSERAQATLAEPKGDLERDRRGRSAIEHIVRFLPIRWRIVSIAALNTAVVVIIAALIWDGAKVLSQTWNEVRQVRESEQLLALLENEAGRLQDLIHRYINQPNSEIFGEILLRREALLSTLGNRGAADPMLAGSVHRLTEVTEQFLAGFNDLRGVQAAISSIYDNEILKPAKDMAGLYGLIESATLDRGDLIWPALGKSREAFTAALVSANVYYLSLAPDAADEARGNLTTIERTIPVMLDLATGDLQRTALGALRDRAAAFLHGLAALGDKFATRTRLFHDEIDGNQALMTAVIDGLSTQMRQRAHNAQERFDRALADVYQKVAIVALAFLAVIVLMGTAIARSISAPLQELRDAMFANISGDHARRVRGTEERDEIGEMARAVEVFRENAIAKSRAEVELRASKDRAERDRAEIAAARADVERTREVLQTVLDNMSDGVMMFDKHFRWRFLNRQLMEFQRFPPDVAYPGASGYDILRFQAKRGDFGPVDDLERVVEERAAVLRNSAGSRYERRTSNGRYIEFNFKPLDEGGTLGVYRDITELRVREEALAAAKEAAETARDAAEHALAELRNAQRSLIEAEKLAALGSLVAGVAHEVNNPVGISLTVASSFARRCEIFAKEVREGAVRRSRLDEFIEGSRDAAHQLVANLQRAGELIQSFKQVAVDRSHAERRVFDLRESTDQIIVSLRPGLKSTPVTLAVTIPENITMDSYPGPYGQVLTNLVLNAVAHGFADGRSGTIVIRARQPDTHHVEITFMDDGAGMNEDVQRRVFDPFFTTRRSQGGTGLGLHIVYNLVTRQLGGRIILQSAPGTGTTFKITLPIREPAEVAIEQPSRNAAATGALSPEQRT